MPISQQLKDAILASGLSANAIAKACGVPQPTITRFLAGAEMKSGTIDRLAEHLGLVLTETQPQEKKPRKK